MTTNLETLNKCVNRTTAFRTWVEMVEVLKTGWVPTLFGRNNSEKYVIGAIKEAGFKVWGNKGQNW